MRCERCGGRLVWHRAALKGDRSDRWGLGAAANGWTPLLPRPARQGWASKGSPL